MKSTHWFSVRRPACHGGISPDSAPTVRRADALSRPSGRCLLLAATLSALAGPVCADGVYRHVMPDGKVVYSDRSNEGEGQSQRLIAPQIRATAPDAGKAATGTESKSPEAKAAEEISARLRGAKTAKAAVRAAPEPAAPAHVPVATVAAPPDPALVQALMGVLGRADLMKRFTDTCSRTLPTSMGKYHDAADGWQRRNGDTVGQAGRILDGGLRPEHGQVIGGEIRRIGDREFAQVSAASMHQRIKWCDNAVDEIKAGKLDVFNNATLTRPLLAFGKT